MRAERVGAAALAVVVALAVLWRLAVALFPYPYRPAVLAAARDNGLDPALLLAVARVESGFRARAVSPDGAVGVMQLTPATAAWIAGRRGLPRDVPDAALADPAYSLAAGAWYLSWLGGRFGGRLAPAVAAYNAGQGAVGAWLSRSGGWNGTAADAAAIPFPETRRFVLRVLVTYAVYRLLYPRAAAPVGDTWPRPPD